MSVLRLLLLVMKIRIGPQTMLHFLAVDGCIMICPVVATKVGAKSDFVIGAQHTKRDEMVISFG